MMIPVLSKDSVSPLVIRIGFAGTILVFYSGDQIVCIVVSGLLPSCFRIIEAYTSFFIIITDFTTALVRIGLPGDTSQCIKTVPGILLIVLVCDFADVSFFIIDISGDSPSILADTYQTVVIIKGTVFKSLHNNSIKHEILDYDYGTSLMGNCLKVLLITSNMVVNILITLSIIQF